MRLRTLELRKEGARPAFNVNLAPRLVQSQRAYLRNRDSARAVAAPGTAARGLPCDADSPYSPPHPATTHEGSRMIYGLPWTSWLLMMSPIVLGLGLALRFYAVRSRQHTP